MALACTYCGQELRPQSRFCPRCGRPLEARLQPGSELNGGDYRIVRSLSKGGMGAVYLAHDRRAFDRLCVVKQMLEYFDVADPGEHTRAQQRFEEEGRVLASLSHPGVPRILAFFVEHGRFYIVMEYIRGDNLEAFVTHEDENGALVVGKRLPQEEIIRYVIQICRILEYLHSLPRPVVHQDVKPANLILEAHLGEVRLVDFGTARAEIPEGATPGSGARASVYGTEGYAPPEQYAGHPVPASDVFALAASAYHLLTDDHPGGHPFQWPKLRDIPVELSVALERALRPDPDLRSTPRELRQALESLATPKRTLEAFTFPGGAQIRSVGALPALCDEHWSAARSFLYNADFQRWLRDLNRHDLVLAADEIVKRDKNRDAGLEAFLRVVDAGIGRPKVEADPASVDLGSVARESDLVRRLTLRNITRGYTQAEIETSQPWIEVRPANVHLWAGTPTEVRVHVHAENLPFRSEQRGTLTIRTPDHEPLEVPVTAHVSLAREMWRVVRRAIGAAFPESLRAFLAAWRMVARVRRTITKPFQGRPWLFWLGYALLGTLLGLGLYYLPPWAEGAHILGYVLSHPATPEGYMAPVVLGPPFLVSLLWLSFLVISLAGSAVVGACRGAFRSFFR